MKQAILLCLFFVASSCVKENVASSLASECTGTDCESTTESSTCSTLKSSTDEPTYCGTSQNLTGQSVIGKATFQARKTSSVGLGDPGSPEPIRYAEVQVFNSSGEQVQCGETDGGGNFAFNLPATADSYEVRIYSRGKNSFVDVSVLENPSTNQPHYISTTITSSGSGSTLNAGTVNASATSDKLKGGAFNIFEQIVKTNEFLRTHSASCESDGCEKITTAEHARVFWKKGETPTTYFGGSGPLSFFSPCDKALFILGGVNGNTDSVDTDHFDNSIIIHEYGHFLEDNYAGTDTPGGDHDGNSIIDPRLAWGEGWANFLQAAVTGIPEYVDTLGNSDGTTQFIFKETLEDRDHDVPSTDGEGNFREFAITRSLWDIIDPHPDSGQGTNEPGKDNVTIDFGSLWTVFTKDFKSSDTHFRNYGLFLEKLVTLEPNKDIQSVLTYEKQKAHQEDYAQLLSKNSNCSTQTTIVGAVNPVVPTISNMFASNDYFQYQHPGGPLNVELVYQSINSQDPTDLDLYVYYEVYTFGRETSDMLVGKDDRYAHEDNGIASVSKSVAAGRYMFIINNAQTTDVPLGAGASYHLKVDGVRLCP